MIKNKIIILFGATGFTGTYIAHRMLALDDSIYQIVFAARNEQAIRLKLGVSLPSSVHLVEADVTKPSTLDTLFSRYATAAPGHVVCIDAVGPFVEYGLPVAAACVRHGVHYVDICGEPLYYLRLVDQLGSEAKARGVSIVPGCGFDCIPTALAIAEIRKDPDVAAVDGFLSVSNSHGGLSGNVGTLKSAINGVRKRAEVRVITRRCGFPTVPLKGRRLPTPILPFRSDRGEWSTLFMGADNAMQLLTDRLNASPEPVARYRLFWAFPNLLSLLGWFWIVFIIALCSLSTFLESVVLRAPRWFTLGVFSEGVDPRQIQTTRFAWRFLLKNTEGRTLRTLRVSGPEPGYIATSGMVLAAAQVVLNDPKVPRGVITPAIAFSQTSLKQDLQQLDVLNFE